MLLAIDVGNTHTVMGLFKGKKISHRLRVTTNVQKTADQWGLLLDSFARNRKFSIGDIQQVILASVVPPVTPLIEEMAGTYIKKKVIVVTADLPVGLNIRYKDPAKVGADRIANAVAAQEHHRLPAIVVDLGTATTFDVISGSGAYQGGVIMPGVESSFYGLASKAAMLPKVDLHLPDKVVGTTPADSMRSGIMYGTIDQIQGMIGRIEKETREKYTIILTGGLAAMFASAFPKAVLDQDLTLEGLRLIFSRIGKR